MAIKEELLHGLSRGEIEETIQAAKLAAPTLYVRSHHDTAHPESGGEQWKGPIGVAYDDEHAGACGVVEQLKKRAKPAPTRTRAEHEHKGR